MSTNEIETRARTMGWLPKEQFKGPETSWVDAKVYLERGEQVMPILQANNRKLTDRLASVEAENRSTKQALVEATEAIEELKKFSTTAAREKVEENKEAIKAAIKQAKKDGDTDAEVDLVDKLQEVNAQLKAQPAASVKPTPAAAPGPTVTPEAQAWMAANPWFSQDKRKTGFAIGIADEWKAAGKPTGSQEFFDHVDEEMAKIFDPNRERRESPAKVGSTNNGSGGEAGSKGRTYADLPPEAKKACEDSARRLVGPNRAYKTVEEWRKRYVSIYDWS